MEKKNSSAGNGFGIFFFGILIGIAATLLLTTKKGRKLLKALIEEGADRISHWEDVKEALTTQLEEENSVEETIIGEEEPESASAPKKLEKIELQPVDAIEDEPVTSEMPDEMEIKDKEDLKRVKKEKIVIEKEIEKEKTSEEEPAPKKKSRLFKGIRRKAS